jgi:hypothetical protein
VRTIRITSVSMIGPQSLLRVVTATTEAELYPISAFSSRNFFHCSSDRIIKYRKCFLSLILNTTVITMNTTRSVRCVPAVSVTFSSDVIYVGAVSEKLGARQR